MPLCKNFYNKMIFILVTSNLLWFLGFLNRFAFPRFFESFFQLIIFVVSDMFVGARFNATTEQWLWSDGSRYLYPDNGTETFCQQKMMNSGSCNFENRDCKNHTVHYSCQIHSKYLSKRFHNQHGLFFLWKCATNDVIAVKLFFFKMIVSSYFKFFSRTDLHNSKQQKDQNTQILSFAGHL